MQNLEITCYLKSPFVNNPPMLDGLLGWPLSIIRKTYCNKTSNLKFIERLPIPLKKEYFDHDGEPGWFYKCSNPIYKVEDEWIERWTKSIEVHKISQKVNKHPKSISASSGLYKQYYMAVHCKNIQFIKYFAVGDKKQIEYILYQILAIGNKRSYGYGFIKSWEIKEIDQDYSIYYDLGNQGKMLMKTIPSCYLKNIRNLAVQNLRKEFGRYKPPYWYPQKYEVIVPC